MTSRPREVWLFYDGYERRAVDGTAARLREDARRTARFAYKTFRRRQTSTGFYTWFLMLCDALERSDVRIRINDFDAARHSPEQVIGVAGYKSIFPKIESLSNPRLLGPGLYGTPLEHPDVFNDPRNALYLQTCAWNEEMFRPWFGDRQRKWFGGFDVSRFRDTRNNPKTIDVLIYDKIIFDRDRFYGPSIERFRQRLDVEGLSHKTVRYGQYHNDDYERALRSSRCMAFFAHSETQGMAYQQCLAMNVPIFAWDEGYWPNPAAQDISDKPIRSTSVPYFDSRCGRTFTIASMDEEWPSFCDELSRIGFAPRDFVRDKLTLNESAELYLDAYGEAETFMRKVAL